MHGVGGRVAFGGLAVLLSAAGGFVATQPLTSPLLAAPAAALVLLFLLVVPQRVLMVGWAALLPLWSVATLDPIVFDALRYGGAGVIVLRNLRSPTVGGRADLRWGLALVAIGLATGSAGIFQGDAGTQQLALTILLSTVAASAVVRVADLQDLLVGYVSGATLSSVVVMLTAAGVTWITPQLNPGAFRLTGLAPSAPAASVSCAVAAILAWGLARGWLNGRRSRWSLVAAAVCSAALLLTGGRVGLAALAVAGIVAVGHGRLRLRHLTVIAVALIGALRLAESRGVEVNTLVRFEAEQYTGSTDITTGRLGTLRSVLPEFIQAPLTGVGGELYGARHGVAPHLAPAFFLITGGLLAALIVSVLTVALVRRLVRRRLDDPAALGALLSAALLAWSLFEPTGPFAGSEGAVLLLVAARLVTTTNPTHRSGLPVYKRPRARYEADDELPGDQRDLPIDRVAR